MMSPSCSSRFKHLACHCFLIFFGLATLPALSSAQGAGVRYGASGSVFVLVNQPDGKLLVGGYGGVARLNDDGSADVGFVGTTIDDTVTAIALQSDGRIVIGGSFTHVGGSEHNHIARLNADGSLDDAFNSSADSSVSTLALQSDGKVVLGGSFTTINAQPHIYLARLNADGSLDAAFNPTFTTGEYDGVLELLLQANGQLLVGGLFTTVDGQTHNNLARLNANGTLDSAFNPNVNSTVLALRFQPDGKLLVGGLFSMVGTETRNNIARLNANGTLDGTFNPDANFVVVALALQLDGKVVLTGSFSSVGGQPRNRIARLNSDGTLEDTFDPNANGNVRDVALRPDGKLVVGGNFTTIGGQPQSYIARLSSDGRTDIGFDPDIQHGAYAEIDVIALQPDGKVVVGGTFDTIDEQTSKHIARLNTDGTLDTGFVPSAQPGSFVPDNVYALAVQQDKKLLVGGDKFHFANLTRDSIVRLNANGSPDTAYKPDLLGSAYTMALQPDGKLIASGNLVKIHNGNSDPTCCIARMNVDGTLDETFHAGTNLAILAAALQPDGKVVLGGYFTMLNDEPRNYIARLNADGTLDSSFNVIPNGVVGTIVLQPDGKLVIGGAFTAIGTQSHNRIARLNADGSVEDAFNLDPSSNIVDMATQTDGKLLIGGLFQTVGGQAHRGIARLNSDGVLDDAFNPYANLGVFGIAPLPDGDVIVSGHFTMIGGQTRNAIARLSATEPAVQSLSIADDGSQVTWSRSGSGPELALPPQLSLSLDGSNFSLVGTMQHVNGGWQRVGFSAPLNTMFYLRARGQVSSGLYNGSVGLIEMTRQFYLSDHIFINGFE